MGFNIKHYKTTQQTKILKINCYNNARSKKMKQGRSKYTEEILAPLVKESFSITEIIRRLGKKESSGMFLLLKKRILDLKLNISHFKKMSSDGGSKTLTFNEILVNRRKGQFREATRALRKAMIASGIEEICEQCNILSEWKGKFLRLEIDHVNGDVLDNSNGNCRFLCPNCHSQTDNYRTKNKSKNTGNQYILEPITITSPSKIRKLKICPICNEQNKTRGKTCSINCGRKLTSATRLFNSKLKTTIWDTIDLKNELLTKTRKQIANELGYSKSAVNIKIKQMQLNQNDKPKNNLDSENLITTD